MRNKVLAKFSSIPFQLHFLHHEFVIPRVHKPSHFSGSFCRNFSSGDLGPWRVRPSSRSASSINSAASKSAAGKGRGREGGPHRPSIHPRTISANLRALQRDPTADIERAEGAVKAGKRYCSLLAPHPPPPFSPGAHFDSTCQILSCGLK